MEAIFKLESHAFEKVLSYIITNLYYTENKTISGIEDEVVVAAKQDLIKLITSHDFDMKEIVNELEKQSWDREKIKYFAKLISSKKAELLYFTLARYNSKYGDTVIDFDWCIKLIFGTSELTKLKYPVLQLILNTVDANGHQDKLLLDTNKEMLSKLINSLEEINIK